MDTYVLTLEKRDEFFRPLLSVRVHFPSIELEQHKGANWFIGQQARWMLDALLRHQGIPHPDVET